MKRAFSVVALSLIITAFAGVSRADPAREVAVVYDDLDLSRSDDAERLLRRIYWAADEVCGIPSAYAPLRAATCRRTAVANGVAAVGSVSLTRLWRAERGAEAARGDDYNDVLLRKLSLQFDRV